jgi:cyclic pyranopterin phosphate synthase
LAAIWGQRSDRYSELRSAGAAGNGGARRVEMHYIGG